MLEDFTDWLRAYPTWDYGTVAEWFGAVGTIGAVIVALATIIRGDRKEKQNRVYLEVAETKAEARRLQQAVEGVSFVVNGLDRLPSGAPGHDSYVYPSAKQVDKAPLYLANFTIKNHGSAPIRQLRLLDSHHPVDLKKDQPWRIEGLVRWPWESEILGPGDSISDVVVVALEQPTTLAMSFRDTSGYTWKATRDSSPWRITRLPLEMYAVARFRRDEDQQRKKEWGELLFNLEPGVDYLLETPRQRKRHRRETSRLLKYYHPELQGSEGGSSRLQRFHRRWVPWCK